MTDNPYTRCPDCTMIAPPSGMDYALAAGGGIDWDQPVRVTCVICHADHHPGAADLAGEFARYRAAHLILAAADRRYRLGSLIAAGRKAVGAARLPWDGDDLASVRALARVWDNLAAALPDQEAP